MTLQIEKRNHRCHIKKILGLIGLTLVSSVLVACGSDQNDNKTLTVGVMTKTSSDDARWKKNRIIIEKRWHQTQI